MLCYLKLRHGDLSPLEAQHQLGVFCPDVTLLRHRFDLFRQITAKRKRARGKRGRMCIGWTATDVCLTFGTIQTPSDAVISEHFRDERGIVQWNVRCKKIKIIIINHSSWFSPVRHLLCCLCLGLHCGPGKKKKRREVIFQSYEVSAGGCGTKPPRKLWILCFTHS